MAYCGIGEIETECKVRSWFPSNLDPTGRSVSPLFKVTRRWQVIDTPPPLTRSEYEAPAAEAAFENMAAPVRSLFNATAIPHVPLRPPEPSKLQVSATRKLRPLAPLYVSTQDAAVSVKSVEPS
jgi:hypothetical protein